MRNLSLKHTIKQGINGLFHICEQELKMCIKDQGVLIFFLLHFFTRSTPRKTRHQYYAAQQNQAFFHLTLSSDGNI